MAKLSADELIKKYTVDKKISEDDDKLIELMEDISDSVVVNDGESEEMAKLKADNEKLANDYSDLKERYKNRFLDSEVRFQEKEVETPEPQEKEIIDIKEI